MSTTKGDANVAAQEHTALPRVRVILWSGLDNVFDERSIAAPWLAPLLSHVVEC